MAWNKWLLTTWPKSISCFSIISSDCISEWYTDDCDIFKTLLIKFGLKTYTSVAVALGNGSWDREQRGESEVKLDEGPPRPAPAFIWSRKDLLWTKGNEGAWQGCPLSYPPAWPSLSCWSLSTLSLSTPEVTQALASWESLASLRPGPPE